MVLSLMPVVFFPFLLPMTGVGIVTQGGGVCWDSDFLPFVKLYLFFWVLSYELLTVGVAVAISEMMNDLQLRIIQN